MKNPFIIILAFLIVYLTSCTERIDIELDSSYTRLVVYGEITDVANRNFVKLSKTSDFFSNEPSPPVSGASIEISDGQRIILLSENKDNPGVYEAPIGFRGIPGRTYTANISEVDIDENGENEFYTARSTLLPINEMDSVTLKYTKNSFFSGWEVQVWAWDPEDVKNFYSFKAYKNGKLLTDSLDDYIVIDDVLFNGNFTFGITALFLNDAELDEKAVPGDTIYLEMNGVTEEFYQFIIDAQSETGPSTPLFSGPPANISTNISNNALGFFTAYSVVKDSTIVPEYPGDNN